MTTKYKFSDEQSSVPFKILSALCRHMTSMLQYDCCTLSDYKEVIEDWTASRWWTVFDEHKAFVGLVQKRSDGVCELTHERYSTQDENVPVLEAHKEMLEMWNSKGFGIIDVLRVLNREDVLRDAIYYVYTSGGFKWNIVEE